LLQFANVGLRYDIGPEILRDITFSIEPGTFHFLTGRSGAGKTSLLRMMFLGLTPTRGEIRLFGKDIGYLPHREWPSLRRRMGVVFQDFRLIDHLTAFENVALPLRIAGQAMSEFEADVKELLTWVGLGDRIDATPDSLSGGEKQRVAIARAVVAKPDLLLADEPTGNVDAEIGRRLLYLFAELNRLGTSVVIATHDRSLVELIDAPELRLEGGHLVRLDPPSDRINQAARPAFNSIGG
jgi:cell division transport system ATP-binding protein